MHRQVAGGLLASQDRVPVSGDDPEEAWGESVPVSGGSFQASVATRSPRRGEKCGGEAVVGETRPREVFPPGRTGTVDTACNVSVMGEGRVAALCGAPVRCRRNTRQRVIDRTLNHPLRPAADVERPRAGDTSSPERRRRRDVGR